MGFKLLLRFQKKKIKINSCEFTSKITCVSFSKSLHLCLRSPVFGKAIINPPM